MDCGFYIIYFHPDTIIKKEISLFWEEQRIISDKIRDLYEFELESKFVEKQKQLVKNIKK